MGDAVIVLILPDAILATMSQHLLTRRMAELLDSIRRADRPPFYRLSVPEARTAYEAASEILELPRTALPRVEALHIAAADGTPLRARLYAPSNEVLPVLLYLHGAHWNLTGSSFRITRWRDMGFAVFAIDYRGFGQRQNFGIGGDWCHIHLLFEAVGNRRQHRDPRCLFVGEFSARDGVDRKSTRLNSSHT
mgnify:CR=1 FL=1